MRHNATEWPKMIRAVYASFNIGRHQGDATARRVMDRTVGWLAGGLELSPKLQAALIDNINMRTAFKVENPGSPIKLTRNQLAYARRTNPEWFDLGLEGVDDVAEMPLNGADLSASFQQSSAAFQQVFSDLSASIQHSFSSLSALFPHQALELAQHLVSVAAEKGGSGVFADRHFDPKVMEWNEKKSNHYQAMISAGGREVASPLVSHEASPEVGDEDMTGQVPDLSHERQADGQDEMISSGGEGVPPAPGRTHRPCVTLWVRPDKRGRMAASGYLEQDGQRHSLVFTGFDHALNRIDAERDVWARALEDQYREGVTREERKRIAADPTCVTGRATMSGLFGANDSRAYKSPLFPDRAVLLEWQGDQPLLAVIVQGDEQAVVEFKREAVDRFKAVLA